MGKVLKKIYEAAAAQEETATRLIKARENLREINKELNQTMSLISEGFGIRIDTTDLSYLQEPKLDINLYKNNGRDLAWTKVEFLHISYDPKQGNYTFNNDFPPGSPQRIDKIFTDNEFSSLEDVCADYSQKLVSTLDLDQTHRLVNRLSQKMRDQISP